MEIKLEITPEMEIELKKVFSEISNNDLEDDIKSFCELSVDIFSDWITGSKRYRSLTEQYIDWVEKIYVNILPEDSKPKYDVLYNNFNMSPGQASYISRVLLEKNLTHWRKQAADELKHQLTSSYQKAMDLVAEGRTDVNIDVSISSLASNELKRISDHIRSEDDTFELPIPKGGYSSFKNFSVPVESWITLKDKIDG